MWFGVYGVSGLGFRTKPSIPSKAYIWWVLVYKDGALNYAGPEDPP